MNAYVLYKKRTYKFYKLANDSSGGKRILNLGTEILSNATYGAIIHFTAIHPEQ